MKLKNYNENELLQEVQARLKDIDQRERIVIKLPFESKVTRIEFYCSETEPNRNSAGKMFSGKQFNGILKLSVYTDFSNKAAEISSYTYQKEFNDYLPKLIHKLYKIAGIQQAA